jgi:hypothetical protein
MTQTERYTLRLLWLECVQAQELDGDEIYLKLGDLLVWKAHPLKMHDTPQTDKQIRAADFENGRVLGREDWRDMDDFQASQFTIPIMAGEHVLYLWEQDVLTSDDRLGETPISIRDESHGDIMVTFNRDGARYQLKYRVDGAWG